MQEIFSAHAPAYWAKGIPVIPLRVLSKAPFLDEWQRFCERMPTDAEQSEWLSKHKSNNMGLPLGPCSGMVAIDVDTIDNDVYDAIMAVIPKPVWVRQGAKGLVAVYKYNGEKGFKIITKNSGMAVELLSKGNQVVLPPSIHPDTNKPYIATSNLYELENLPVLPDKIEEKLRAALSKVVELKSENGSRFKISGHVGAGARDIQMTRYAGLTALQIEKGEISMKRGIDNMQAWCENNVAKVNGDEIDMEKGMRKVVEFVVNDVTSRSIALPPGWDEDLGPEEKLKWGLDFTEEQEEWTAIQLNDYIYNQLNDVSSPTDPKRMTVTKYVLNKIAKSVMLTDLEVGQVLMSLKELSGLKLPISYYHKELKSLKKGTIDGENHAEIADEVIKLYEERVSKLAFHDDDFWNWTGTHWMKLDPSELWRLVAKNFGHLPAAKKANDHRGILEVMRKCLPSFKDASGEASGVNFANGFLTKELKLLPHAPEQGMTYVLEFSYMPEEAGKSAMFFQYLQDSWGHQEDYTAKKQMIREAMAATLFGMAPSFQKVFLLKGTGDTGKSVLLEIIETLVPEEAKASVPPDRWHERFLMAEIAGKLLNRCGELKDRHKIEGATFKEMVTGGEQTGEHKNQNPFRFRPRCAHWFASNFYPKTTDGSHGFNRRWMILGFDKIVGEDKKIIDLGQKIAYEEVEGIVAWVVQCLPELIKRQKYTTCPSSDLMNMEMSLENSPTRQFLRDRISFKEGKHTLTKELYTCYMGYLAATHAGKVQSLAVFTNEFDELLRENRQYSITDSANGVIYNNIYIKTGK